MSDCVHDFQWHPVSDDFGVCSICGAEADLCGRLLVGQGGDTYDPPCALPAGHDGRCQPAEAMT